MAWSTPRSQLKSLLFVSIKAKRAGPWREPSLAISTVGHSLHFGSVLMSGSPPTTTEWRTFENGRNVPERDVTRGVRPCEGLLIHARTPLDATLGDGFGPTR